METNTPTLIRKKELAQRLSVSPRTIDNWVSRRVIPYIQLSSRFNLYDPEAVIEALRKTYQIEALD
ncbi:MAG: helix-turn-helix transcriptional regulator [Verrucomicrobiota bacterium]